jgi:GH24 family phage-related lysozyme (muramidase)
MTTQYDFTAPFEGVADCLYIDTKDNVTTGVGFLVSTLIQAESMPFTPIAAVATDWAFIKTMGAGHPLAMYRARTRARLPADWIRREFDVRMTRFAYNCADIWPEFDSFPEPARIAILDMAWNLGVRGLSRNWPTLKAAVKAKDWRKAAANCHRKDVGDARNNATAGMFSAAA